MSTSTQTASPQSALIEVRHLKKYFALQKQWFLSPTQFVRAVDNVSFTMERGETLGLVGESGSGKPTVGRLLPRAIDPDAGEILAHYGDTVDLAQLERRELRAYRPSMQMIFQDPYESLNPRMTVRDIIADPLVAMNLAEGQAINDRVVEIAERCQFTQDICRTTVPEWQEHAAGQFAACHFAEELDLSGPAAV